MKQYSIISYRLAGLPQSIKTKVSQFVYGKRSKKRVGNKVYDYSYKGLKDKEGAILIAESAIMLPRQEASGFEALLKENKVEHSIIVIWK